MARRVDPALTRRALKALDRAVKAAAQTEEGLSEWEAEFIDTVRERLNTYGSAFSDPDKGQLSAPLSLRQGLKVRQIRRKAEPKAAAVPAAEDGDEARPAPVRKARKPLVRKTPLRARKPE